MPRVEPRAGGIPALPAPAPSTHPALPTLVTILVLAIAVLLGFSPRTAVHAASTTTAPATTAPATTEKVEKVEKVDHPRGLGTLLAPGTEMTRLATGMGFTEGPVWLPRQNKLVFSDIPAARLMQWQKEHGVSVFRESANPNGNALDEKGRLLTCQHGARNIVRSEVDGGHTVIADRFDGKRLNSPNDLAVQSDGVIWFTDPPWGLPRQTEGKELDGHWVLRFVPTTGKLHPVLRELAMPNGIALSPDERRLYVADTGGHPSHPNPDFRDRPATVSAYRIDGGGIISPATPVWSVNLPCDGMCVDERGNIYTTGRDRITILRPTGVVLGEIPVPENPANVCFGGDDFRTLFITARTSLYAIRLEVAGHRLK